MNIENKEKGMEALEEIERILKQKINEIEEHTTKTYMITIGEEDSCNVYMCINLDDYFKAGDWCGEIPTDTTWRDIEEIKEDLKEIERDINNKYEEHIEMLEKIRKL